MPEGVGCTPSKTPLDRYLQMYVYIPLICYENSLWTKKLPAIFGGMVGRSSRLPYAQQGLGILDQTCNIKWLQRNLSSQGLYDRRLKVRQWQFYTIPRSAPGDDSFSFESLILQEDHNILALKMMSV